MCQKMKDSGVHQDKIQIFLENNQEQDTKD